MKPATLLTGDEWAERHGGEWQTFLKDKLKKCECANPRVSHSNRAKSLSLKAHEERDGIAQGEPAACLMCFAPIETEVRRSLCRGWSSPRRRRAMSPRAVAMSPGRGGALMREG